MMDAMGNRVYGDHHSMVRSVHSMIHTKIIVPVKYGIISRVDYSTQSAHSNRDRTAITILWRREGFHVSMYD